MESTKSTYFGQPIENQKGAKGAWEALLGKEQNRAVWIGREMADALAGAEGAPARMATYNWCFFGALTTGTAAALFFSPLQPREVLLLSFVAYGGYETGTSFVTWLQGRRLKGIEAKTDERVEEHKELLKELAGKYPKALTKFLKDRGLASDKATICELVDATVAVAEKNKELQKSNPTKYKVDLNSLQTGLVGKLRVPLSWNLGDDGVKFSCSVSTGMLNSNDFSTLLHELVRELKNQ